MQTAAEQKQIKMAFIVSAVSGALILLQGILRFIRTQWGLELGIGELRKRSLEGIDFKILSVISIILGIMVILGAILILRTEKIREGGITVLAFSVLSILAGGGYLAGLILGVIGGALTLSQYQPRQQSSQQSSS